MGRGRVGRSGRKRFGRAGKPAGERSLAMLLTVLATALVFDLFWWLRR